MDSLTSCRCGFFTRVLRLGYTILALSLMPLSGLAQSTAEHLRRSIEYAHDSEDREIAGAGLVAVNFLTRFYEARRFAPAWSQPDHVEQVVAALEGSYRHGLLPEDFHIDAIRLLQQLRREEPDDAGINANLDLLLTDGLVTYAYQLVYGKVDPRDLAPSWNLSRPLLAREPEEVLEQALAEGNLAEVLASLEPALPYYTQMQRQLATFRRLANSGGWSVIPAGATLREGDTGPRVTALRARLTAVDDEAKPAGSSSQLFDPALAKAVRRFQLRHGLKPDGLVGPATLQVMNITAAERVEQIRVNMERARWLRQEFGDMRDFVVVNTAGFHVRLYQEGAIEWETRAIVGTAYHQTPVFAADMKYIVLNPTWTVPRSIIRDEMIPQIKADPSYLASKGFDLVDASGRPVDPRSVDWPAVSPNNFPYGLVQRSGPANALGRVKFMLPNAHAVYLHDTPSRELFARAGRTFSHGCVRIENPLELAALLLGDQPEWTRDAIEATVRRGETTTVFLTEPLRVFILYWTAEPAEAGGIRFYRDAYDRDGAVLAALNAPFRPLTSADR